MTKYILKSALVAEIERRIKSLNKDRDFNYLQIKELEALLSFSDSLEEEPVSNDLEEAVRKNVVLETNVMKDSDGDGIDTPYKEWLTLEDTEIPFIPDDIGLKDGDKVKVIIIKQL